MPEWRVKSIKLGVVSLERNMTIKRDKSIVTIFEDILRDLWSSLEKEGIKLILLMLDDLHYFAQQFPDGLYDIRGIFQRLPRDGCNVMLVITSPRSLFDRAREFAEPFTRFFERHELISFDRNETENAILTPIGNNNLDITVTDEAIDYIHQLTQGHPYFISFVMEELVDRQKQGTIDLDFLRKQYPSISKRLAMERFESDFLLASEAEQQILIRMADLGNVVAPSEFNIGNARLYLKKLVENKELVVKRGRGKYSLYHPLFKEYLRAINDRGNGA